MWVIITYNLRNSNTLNISSFTIANPHPGSTSDTFLLISQLTTLGLWKHMEFLPHQLVRSRNRNPTPSCGTPERDGRAAVPLTSQYHVCWITYPSVFSPSVIRYPIHCVSLPGWPMPVCSPFHTGCWVPQWHNRVGVGTGSATALALCARNRRPGRSARRRWLESLLRRKREKKESKSPYWIL